jgi:hypothetical protein
VKIHNNCRFSSFVPANDRRFGFGSEETMRDCCATIYGVDIVCGMLMCRDNERIDVNPKCGRLGNGVFYLRLLYSSVGKGNLESFKPFLKKTVRRKSTFVFRSTILNS